MDRRTGAREGSAKQKRDGKSRLDITVLMGGPSSEREVSLVSGAAVADALERCGHKVVRSDISPTDASALDRKGIDVVFIVLHGDFGESGKVQQLCKDRHLRYTGSGPMASEMAMDKAASKQVFRKVGINTPDWVIVEESQTLPEMVKAVDGGSSVDITIARTAAQRDEAVSRLTDKSGRAMVEVFVKGREFTVGILGERALPVLEVIPSREFYDYTAKYADDAGTRYNFDHGLDEGIVTAMQKQAVDAFAALGCRDMSRVDFMLDERNVPQILEINTIPGFTSHSLLPKAAQRAGISFERLVDLLAGMAMQRPRP